MTVQDAWRPVDPRPRVVRKPPTFLHFWADFACEQDGSSSMARLCALLCCVTGCTCGALTLSIVWHHPDIAPGVVLALVGVTTALIASGCVAILLRTRAVPGGEQS